MLLNKLVPMQRFVSTDIIGNRYFNKYTVGYIYSSFPNHRGERVSYQVKGLITRVGKTGKNRIKPVDFQAPPIVFKKLVGTGFYDQYTFVLCKPECVNVLKMANFEFLAWAYANILRLENAKIHHILPDPYDPVVKRVRSLGRNFDDYRDKDVAASVGSVQNRAHIVSQFHKLDTFIRKMINIPAGSNVTMLKRHYELCDDAVVKKLIITCLESLDKDKEFPKNLQMESADVLQEYENSGYWF